MGEAHTRVGHVEDWPHLANLWFSKDIDRFTKFEERIYLISKEDRVYAYGNQSQYVNLFGINVGFGQNLSEPTEIMELQNKKIIKFATGNNHTLALSADGTVWAWGKNNYGQLGDGSNTDHFQPVRVGKISGAIDIATYTYSSFALTRGGEVFAWGNNYRSQLGFADSAANTLSPVRLRLENVASLQTTFFDNSLATTKNGQLFVWGFHAKSAPRLVQVSHVSVATTYQHYYVLGKDGRILRSLANDQLNVEVFYQGSLKFKALYADRHSSPGFVIAEAVDGQLYMWTDADGVNTTPALSITKDIARAFAFYDYKGHQPFMVQLGDNTTTTPTPTPSPNQTCGRLCQLMEKMFNNKTASNTEFHIDRQTIYVDRDILISASAYMAQQFAGAWKEKTSIAITDYGYQVYYLYLHYLYTDRLSATVDEAVELYVLARELHEDQLKQRCHEIIKHNA